jgi:hypothetical protein
MLAARYRCLAAPVVALLAGLGLAAPAGLTGQAAATEEAQVLAVVQELFDAMAAGDAARAAAVMLPQGQWVAVRLDEAGNGVPLVSPFRDFLARLDQGEEQWLERMWEARVLMHDPIAVVWTPYDFYRDGAFSHCGVDGFTLVRTADGWRMVGGTYTVETAGCAPSPLGPLDQD